VSSSLFLLYCPQGVTSCYNHQVIVPFETQFASAKYRSWTGMRSNNKLKSRMPRQQWETVIDDMSVAVFLLSVFPDKAIRSKGFRYSKLRSLFFQLQLKHKSSPPHYQEIRACGCFLGQIYSYSD